LFFVYNFTSGSVSLQTTVSHRLVVAANKTTSVGKNQLLGTCVTNDCFVGTLCAQLSRLDRACVETDVAVGSFTLLVIRHIILLSLHVKYIVPRSTVLAPIVFLTRVFKDDNLCLFSHVKGFISENAPDLCLAAALLDKATESGGQFFEHHGPQCSGCVCDWLPNFSMEIHPSPKNSFYSTNFFATKEVRFKHGSQEWKMGPFL
jgi:hypothetical protein